MAERARIFCPGCFFWVEHEPDEPSRAGRCHRFAPRPKVLSHGEGSGNWADWPETYEYSWCGEAEPLDG